MSGLYRIYTPPSTDDAEDCFQYFSSLPEMTVEGNWLAEHGQAFQEEVLCQAGLGHGWQATAAGGTCRACADGQTSGDVCKCDRFIPNGAGFEYCPRCGEPL